ncbi:hypothetical protein D9M70_333680 [compost metagenome]
MGLRQHQVDDAVEQLAQVQRRRGDGQAAGLDLGVVEDVIQDLRQRRAGLLGQRQHAALVAIQLGLFQQFHQPEHTVHRRADLVAHHRQEAFLGAQCGLGGFLGDAQCAGLVMPLGDVRDDAVPYEVAAFKSRHRPELNPAGPLHAGKQDFEFQRRARGRRLLHGVAQPAPFVRHQQALLRGDLAKEVGCAASEGALAIASGIDHLAPCVARTAPALEYHVRQAVGHVLQLTFGGDRALPGFMYLRDIHVRRYRTAGRAIAPAERHHPEDDRAKLPGGIAQFDLDVARFHRRDRLLLQCQQSVHRSGRLRVDRLHCMADDVVPLYPEESLERGVERHIAAAGVPGGHRLGQAGQQRLLESQLVLEALLDAPPQRDLLPQPEMAHRQHQHHQRPKRQHRPDAFDGSSPGHIELIGRGCPFAMDALTLQLRHHRQRTLQRLAQGLEIRCHPQADFLVEAGQSRNAQVSQAAPAQQGIHGGQVAQHGVGVAAVHHVERFARAMHRDQVGMGKPGSYRFLHRVATYHGDTPVRDVLEAAGIWGVGRDHDHHRRHVDGPGRQHRGADRLLAGSGNQVDFPKRQPLAGIHGIARRHVAELDTQAFAKGRKVVDEQARQIALRILDGVGRQPERHRIADNRVPEQRIAFRLGQCHGGNASAQPPVPQCFHDIVRRLRQPAVEFAQNAGIARGRGKAESRCFGIQPAYDAQSFEALLTQCQLHLLPGTHIDVRLTGIERLQCERHGCLLRHRHAGMALAQFLCPRRARFERHARTAREAVLHGRHVILARDQHGRALQVWR